MSAQWTKFQALIRTGCVALAMAGARAEPIPEYTMKATYLFNFMVFSQWPAASMTDDSIRLCVLGGDPFGSALDALEGKSINGRRLAVQRLRGYARLRDCQLLFVPESEAPNMESVLQALGEAPVLTVSDHPSVQGCGIQMGLEGKRLVFDVNVGRVRRTGVAVSSKVLQLARSTPGAGP